MRVTRTDNVTGRLGKFERTGAGAVKVPATIARPGLLHYPGRVEYRPPEETFRADTVNSLRSVPVTWGHPEGRLVTPENARELQRGLVSDQDPEIRVRVDGSDDEWIRATLIVTDAELISAIEAADDAGLPIEVSAGYNLSYLEEPGVAPDGTRYDGIQTGVTFNHVAILAMTANPRARAGSEARVRLDNQERQDMEEELKAAIERAEKAEARADKAEARADAAEAKAEKAEARADAAEEKAEKAEARNDAQDIDALVQERYNVLSAAATYLPQDYDAKGKSNAEIRRDALSAAVGADKLAGKSDIYVEARFDALCDGDAPAQYGVSKQTREDASTNPGESRLDNDDDFRKSLAEKAAR